MTVLNLNRSRPSDQVPRVLAITGGKGGIGKSSLAVNLSIALSRSGSKVCLFDADTGLANINVMLGIHPAYTLEHLFTGEKSIQDIVIEGPEGVHVVPGASGFAQCVELDVGQQQRLVTSVQAIEPHYDYMLVDTAAGISPTVLHFIAASQLAVVVITPEPTSLTDAFSLLKVLRRRGYRRKVQVVVNMTPNTAQADKVYRRFEAAVAKYLKLRTEYLGAIWMDESMRTAVTLQRPVALFPKNDPSARSFYRIAERLDAIFSRPGVPRLAFSAYWAKLVEVHASRSKPSTPAKAPVVGSGVVDLSGKAYQEPLTQVQKQQEEQQKEHALRSQVEQAQEPSTTTTISTLSETSEHNWIDLRVKLNRFISDQNTTPEQVTTLLSSCIFGYGDRLGAAAVDLLHGILTMLDAQGIDQDQRMLLRSEFERLGFLKTVPLGLQASPESDPEAGEDITVTEPEQERYDAEGFGCQDDLAQKIRQASAAIPLENLLESIKYASLVSDQTD